MSKRMSHLVDHDDFYVATDSQNSTRLFIKKKLTWIDRLFPDSNLPVKKSIGFSISFFDHVVVQGTLQEKADNLLLIIGNALNQSTNDDLVRIFKIDTHAHVSSAWRV